MKTKLGLTLALVLGLLAILFVAGIAPGRPARAAERALSGRSLAASTSAGGDPIGSVFTITNESLQEVSPAVAYNPDRQEYLAVWHNDRAGCDDIRAQRMSRGGALAGGSFYVSAGCSADRRNPDVAYNSAHDQYLVAWEQESAGGYSIQARRVSGAGQVLDGSDVTVRTSGGNTFTPGQPAVAYAWTSDRYLVVWEETWHPGSITHSIYGQLMDEKGSLEGGRFSVSEGSDPRQAPDVAYCRTRNEHLVVWTQGASGDIYARRVTGGGLPLASAISVSTLGHDEEDPAVAALPITKQEGDYLVTWEIDTGSDTGIDAKTVHVASDGSALVGVLPQIVYDSSANESNPSVVGNESAQQYLVAWTQHYAITGSSGTMTYTILYDGIAGRAVSSGGELLSGTFMDEGAYVGGWDADRSAVAAGPLGDFLVVYEDTPVGETDSDISGRLWGNRVYLPMVLRNHS